MKKIRLLSLSVPLLVAFLLTMTSTAQSVELVPTQDAYLENGTRYGGSLLRVEKGTRVRESYMLFDISGVSGAITSMELTLVVTSDAGSGPVTLYLSNSVNWNESNLSNANKPGLDISLGTIPGPFGIGSSKIATINPSLVTGNTFSLIIVHSGPDGDDMAFGSRSAAIANQPKLAITYTTGDTQSPSAPVLTSTGQSQSTVDLSWSGATDNVGVTGYTVFQDNVQIQGNITGTSYQVTGLVPSTAYNFKVKAYDAAGNQSADSNTLTITTDADQGSGGGTSGTSVWTESNTTASYSGEVAIGRSTVPANYKLAVEGNIRAREVRVDTESWPDYVFTKDYDLPSLEEIQKHIREKGHLPNIPSAQEVRTNGVELGEMDRLLLEKIEELTLYILQQKEQNQLLKKRMTLLEEKILANDQP